MAFEVHAVRYATLRSSRADLFYRHSSYGEPDAELEMAYYFWILRDGDETIVVDCGFSPEAGERRGRTCLCPPLDALRLLGVEPASVTSMIVTHLHYDHIGISAHFPRRRCSCRGASWISGRAPWPVACSSRRSSSGRRSSSCGGRPPTAACG